jgi:tetratricopeptide (TPR) repeat protein
VMKWDKERKTATLHALVRSFLQLKVDEASTLKQILAETILQFAKQIEQILTLEQIDFLQDFVPHLQAVSRHYINLLCDDQFLSIFIGSARFYDCQGLYSLAEPWYINCLKIAVQRLGQDHPYTATSLNNLAVLYKLQGRYEKAESLYLQSLKIREEQLGAEHTDVACSLNNLVDLYKLQGLYSKAEPLCRRSLNIWGRQHGKDHTSVAISLGHLAGIHHRLGRYHEAKPLYLLSLSIFEWQLGIDHPYVANGLNNLAELYISQGLYDIAESLRTCLKSYETAYPSLVLGSNRRTIK